MAKSKNKYYVVWVGQNPGIYNSWQECKVQISGFPNAKYKAFKSLQEAREAFDQSAVSFINNDGDKSTPSDYRNFLDEIVEKSISVDAACSGNPGIMEYRGVDTVSAEEIFRMGPFKKATNNIGEFLALVHALAWLKKRNDSETAIYTDSKTGLSWLRNRKVKTTLNRTPENEVVFKLIDRALFWLKNNSYKNRLLKWNTEKWGEIPADFGRK